MNKSESIEKTKKCFEESFRSGSFYNKQTRDEKHFHIKVRQGMKILDLGTGTGYLSFPFAERYKVFVPVLFIINSLQKDTNR